MLGRTGTSFYLRKKKRQNSGPKKYKMPIVFSTELYPKFLSGSGSNFREELTFTAANISSGTFKLLDRLKSLGKQR